MKPLRIPGDTLGLGERWIEGTLVTGWYGKDNAVKKPVTPPDSEQGQAPKAPAC